MCRFVTRTDTTLVRRHCAGAAAAVLCWVGLGTGLGAASTVVVSPVGTPANNGTALLAALAGIVALGPTADEPYLLKIDPGIYDVGSSPVVMADYVSIEGSGEAVTLIRGTLDSVTQGVVNGAEHTELRLLTVENTGGGSVAIAVHTQGASMIISEVTARAGSATVSRGIFAQPLLIMFNDAVLTLRDVTAETPFVLTDDAVGVSACCSARFDLVNVTASGRTGLLAINREITARNSVFRGASQSVLVDLATTNLVSTRLDGKIVVGSGQARCVGAHDQQFAPLGSDCKPLPPGLRK